MTIKALENKTVARKGKLTEFVENHTDGIRFVFEDELKSDSYDGLFLIQTGDRLMIYDDHKRIFFNQILKEENGIYHEGHTLQVPDGVTEEEWKSFFEKELRATFVRKE